MHPSNPPTTDSGRTPLYILCVEDNDPDYDLVLEYLELAPKKPTLVVHRAETMASARQQLLEAKTGQRFHLVLCDLNLPDSSGEATFDAIQEVAPEVAIAVLTGEDDHNLGLMLVKKGAQDFLPKDQLSPTFLFRSILHAIERKRSRVEMIRLNADLKSAQLQLIQAEKLESLGRLSAGVAHEIKNPLAMLQGCVDFYAAREAAGEEEVVIQKVMQEAITRATSIVSGMLDFSRHENLEFKLASLNTLIHYAIDLIEPQLRAAGIEVTRELAADLPVVNLDPIKIEQVFVNLIVNAMHASADGGRITVRTYLGEIDNVFRDEGTRTLKHLRSGDEIVVAEIRDYGSGIPEEILSKIFDPFFTTKATGKGTGLGLSVCKTIVDLHGGMLRIRNMDPPGVRAQVILATGSNPVSMSSSDRITPLASISSS